MTSQLQPFEDDEQRLLRRRAKLEANLTSGCGWGKAKKKLLDVFWNSTWIRLESEGWTKVEGTGRNVGSIFFIPKGVDIGNSKKGRDYYDRIRDVIDRVLEKRNTIEGTIAEQYLSDMNVQITTPDEVEVVPRSTRRNATRNDLSWKEGGSNFPKATSRVGPEYQATSLPPAGSFQASDGSKVKVLYDAVWNPQSASKAGCLDYIHDNVPYSKKEAGMVAIHDIGYRDTTRLDDILSQCKPLDGSDWTDDEKNRFRSEIFRFRKNMSALSKAMGRSVNNCMTYYLGNFKKSDDYRLLKTVCAEERAERQAASDQGLDACAVCGDGGSLLICDGCEGEYHMGCQRPPLANVPEGQWECDDCVNMKFWKARDNLIRNTTVYERVDGGSDKRHGEDKSNDAARQKRAKPDPTLTKAMGKSGIADEIILRPSLNTMRAVKALAACINMALSMPNET